MRSNVVHVLDEIAERLEARGATKLASELDKVSAASHGFLDKKFKFKTKEQASQFAEEVGHQIAHPPNAGPKDVYITHIPEADLPSLIKRAKKFGGELDTKFDQMDSEGLSTKCSSGDHDKCKVKNCVCICHQ